MSKIPASLAKYADRIADYSDERKFGGDGVWVYLKEGWFSPDMDCMTIHEDTVRECIPYLKNCVRKEES